MIEKLMIGVAVIVVLALVWTSVNLALRRFRSSRQGCPRCHKPVARLHRTPWQRLISKVIPGLRHFVCQECGWRGLLIQFHHR
jgi:hypothetical protein